MELIKRSIHRKREKGKAVTQITLDDDFNVPDHKTDVVRLIQEKGEIRIQETSITPGHIWLKGVLQFCVLYRSEGEGQKMNYLNGEIPFQESLALDEVEEEDLVKIKWQIEDLTVGVINSRKLSVKALVLLSALVSEIRDEEVVTAIGYEEEIEVLENSKNILQLFLTKKDTFRFKEDAVLPSNKPNIQEVLWKSIQLRGVETRLLEDQMQIKGEVLLFVLYMGEEETERLQWMETALPFTGILECEGCTEDMLLDVSYEIASAELEPRPDYDGEERVWHLELVLELAVSVFQEEEMQILEDLYGRKRQLLPVFETKSYEQLLLKNFSKCKVNDRIRIGEGMGGILQLCTSEGNVLVEQTEVIENGIQVLGTLTVTILYITAEDKNPLASVKQMIPFGHIVEIPGITKECLFQMESSLEQLTTVMLDSSLVEVKAMINLNTIVMEEKQISQIVEVQEFPLDLNALQERPGIVGYIGRENDRLWDIAKENDTTVAKIQEMNQLEENILRGGEKILIIKKIG